MIEVPQLVRIEAYNLAVVHADDEIRVAVYRISAVTYIASLSIDKFRHSCREKSISSPLLILSHFKSPQLPNVMVESRLCKGWWRTNDKALQPPPDYAAPPQGHQGAHPHRSARPCRARRQSELILLYWSISWDILDRQQAEDWGQRSRVPYGCESLYYSEICDAALQIG